MFCFFFLSLCCGDLHVTRVLFALLLALVFCDVFYDDFWFFFLYYVVSDRISIC
ncbi:hypothetical protein KFK09_011452 [Dendrobium nobile]|uniref:Uncharacterized protein n=1 Tax=Dendrobium nobile TaxID=94219 RepID=A0A8T3BEM4_DENNO|nr:hypothetical protein KFK09_011452 [Dendrobium nobile]